MTDSLEYITSTLCKTDEHVDIINRVLKDALSVYQWKYQNADYRRVRDAENSANKTLREAAKLLRDSGKNTLADELEHVFNSMLLTKQEVLDLAASMMKNELLESGMSLRKHKDKYSALMKQAFIEHCKEYPLQKAQFYLD